MSPEKLADVIDIIDRGNRVRETGKQATLLSEYSDLADNLKAVRSYVLAQGTTHGYSPYSALLVLMAAVALYIVLYRKRFMR